MTKVSTIQSVFLNLNDDGLTITSQLAKDKESNAVKKVIALGGKVEDAIYGAALAGDTAQVNHYLADCPQAKTKACIGNAIKGYARAGNFDAIYAIKNYRDYRFEIVMGEAQAGRHDKVNAMITKDISLFAAAIEGYADTNQAERLIALLKNTSLYTKAIYCAARSGHTALVNNLLNECGISADFKVSLNEQPVSSVKNQAQIIAYSLLNQAATGYVAGYHFKEAASMLERGASISLCLSELPMHNREPFLVLLCYVQNEQVAEQLLAQIKLLFSISDDVVPEDIFEKIKKIKASMEEDKKNYIEAKYTVENSGAVDATDDEEITLPYLLKTLSAKLDWFPKESSAEFRLA